ncbi:hypothetical protein ACA910_004552 [Epithemia clementina (nom. ined.)]
MQIQASESLALEIKPDILKEENWEEWLQEFPIYLSHISGKQNALLAYVIQPDVLPGHVHGNPSDAKMYIFPLSGLFFREDNKEVYWPLSNCVKNQAATWIQPYHATQNGGATWLALEDCYNGGGQKEKQINKVEAVHTNLFYNNKRVYPFDAYAAFLMQAFRTLDTTPYHCLPANQV